MEVSGVSVQERWLSIYSVMEIEAGKPLPQMFLWNHFLWERLSSRDLTLGLAH